MTLLLGAELSVQKGLDNVFVDIIFNFLSNPFHSESSTHSSIQIDIA